MQSTSEWRITVLQGLKAHFKQPNGPSKPGTDWMVAVGNGVQEFRILVRAYADDVVGLDQQGEVAAMVGFVAGLVRGGWTPDKWKGEPGELTFSRPRTAQEAMQAPQSLGGSSGERMPRNTLAKFIALRKQL